MNNEKHEKRLFEIHTLINPALHPDRLDPDRIELAEELLNDLRNELAMEEPLPSSTPDEIRAQIFDRLNPEYIAQVIESLPVKQRNSIVKTFFIPPPVKRIQNIRISI